MKLPPPATPPEKAEPLPPALIVGIDWADLKYDVCLLQDDGGHRTFKIDSRTETVHELLAALREHADGKPIAICLEKSRIRLVHTLATQDDVWLYMVDPKQLRRYRESFKSSGAKSDPNDCEMLARLLHERRGDLRRFKPDDALTRKLDQLCHTRRSLVNDRTSLRQQLQDTLKNYFPLLLELPGSADSPLVCEVLRRWPDPRKFQKLNRQTLHKLFARHGVKDEEQVEAYVQRIRRTPLVSREDALIVPLSIRAEVIVQQIEPLNKAIAKLEQEIDQAMNEHPDAHLFTSIPGAGKAMAPRLLTALGTDRERHQSADEIATYSGIAPVKKESGKTSIVHRRLACPKYVRQTFHEFADAARKWSDWSGAFYRYKRAQGMRHNAALRALAFKWIRILYRVWQTRTPYDEARYLEQLRQRNSPVLEHLK